MRYQKSHGLTASETILAELCERSFLQLWTYPNLFKKPGKELTDLLVIFHDSILIFSDKSCSYPDTGNPVLDWQRWYRRAIAESAHQIHEAERWIRMRPDQIYLDSKCGTSLPLQLPHPQRMSIHRICVVTGAAERCYKVTGHRSLAIDLDVIGDTTPFTVGRINSSQNWLHIFDEQSLQLILSELSTITDVVNYLEAKTRLLDDKTFRRAASEADLLAYYLLHNRSFPTAKAPYSLRTGLWQSVESDARFQAGRKENEVSTFWDGLIEHITDHYLGSTLEVGNDLSITDYEQLARIMASETRFHRRILAKAILERAERAREAKIGSLLASGQPDVAYVLLIGQGAPREAYAEYRADRSRELQLRCIAAKAAKPECRFIVGIALDARGVKGSSEDFVLIDTEDWTNEILTNATKIRQDLGYFLPGKATMTRIQEDEYPRT